ncbi:MAG TPA: pantoate--beta-alanine ligase [Acidimicrobiales bacterium]|nr:pantoate--beta-alanine ligase [Acidimicrobiales bacterium]
MGPGVANCKLVESVGRLDEILAPSRRRGLSIGFVPTLGGLHAGHAALIGAARRASDLVVVSIFLNPIQFDDPGDLGRYPHDVTADRALAGRSGADVVFAPPVEAMYPEGRPVVTVDPGALGVSLEGAARPGHFRGVATVVAKLLALVLPSVAYFGEKDYQQLVVVRRLVSDLSLPVEIVACPTVRDPDGLAVSSRNAFLDAGERRAATVLYRALRAGAEAVRSGVTDGGEIEATMRSVVASEPSVILDYAKPVADGHLEPLSAVGGDVVLLVAARVGKVRLIDNLRVAR